MINAKSTKAQLLEHIAEIEDQLQADQLQLAAAQPVSLTDRLAAFRNESVALVRDVYLFGAFCRKGFQGMLDELKSLGYTRA